MNHLRAYFSVLAQSCKAWASVSLVLGEFSFKQTNIIAWGWMIIHLDNHGSRIIFNIRFSFFNDRIHMMCEEEFWERQEHHKIEGAIRHNIEFPFPWTDHVEGSLLSKARTVLGLIVKPLHYIPIQSDELRLLLKSFKLMLEKMTRLSFHEFNGWNIFIILNQKLLSFVAIGLLM